MITCSNLKTSEFKKENLLVIWADIRNSTEMNEKDDPKKLHKTYENFFLEFSSIMNRNGFNQIDIQGDGVYAISDNSLESKVKALKEINSYAIKNPDLFTISVNYGKENIGCFGGSSNKEKQMAFFGNVVSLAKKWISFSPWNDGLKARIIISKSAYLHLGLKDDEKKLLEIKLKGNKEKNKKYKGYY